MEAASPKVSPIGHNPHGMFDRPSIDAPVSAMFKARAKDLTYISECQGTCNCESILGEGETKLSAEQIADIIPKIQLLNVDSVKYELMHPDSGNGMTREQVDVAEQWYKRFLILVISNLGKNIVPHKVIDRFWHTHILDTRKYADDCQKTFGFMLHHFPFFGIRDDNDFAHLVAAGDEAKDLYFETFGESLSELSRKFSN